MRSAGCRILAPIGYIILAAAVHIAHVLSRRPCVVLRSTSPSGIRLALASPAEPHLPCHAVGSGHPALAVRAGAGLPQQIADVMVQLSDDPFVPSRPAAYGITGQHRH
jgi:hypothetical protein